MNTPNAFRDSYEQRRMRSITNEAKMLVAGHPDESSHATHLDFLYSEWDRATTENRRQEVRADVEEYIRLLSNQADRQALAQSGADMESSSIVDLRLPVYSEEPPTPQTPPMKHVDLSNPPPPPQRKKAGTLPLSPPPTPILMALDGLALSQTGNVDEDIFHLTLDYQIEAMEAAEEPEAKMAAYTRIFEFILTQPINLLKDPTLRELAYESLTSTSLRVPGHANLELLIDTFNRLYQTLRSHPYYVPHPSGRY
jgi:hypothetical protein